MPLQFICRSRDLRSTAVRMSGESGIAMEDVSWRAAMNSSAIYQDEYMKCVLFTSVVRLMRYNPMPAG